MSSKVNFGTVKSDNLTHHNKLKKIGLKTLISNFFVLKSTKTRYILQKFSRADNLWSFRKFSQSGQSVGGQSVENYCI